MTFRTRALALALLPLAYAIAQQSVPIQIDDPANLMGERVSAPSPADNLPINHGAPALQQLLLKIRTRASLMLIVAHPDDEDGGMLTYESRGHGVRVADLSLTRGEGGQNLMSADFNDALGLIRTQELLAADRYFGADQFFGTEVDFGFSKTKEETFAQWTHDRVLYDAVRAIRLYRPLVLTAVFVGGPTDGHGQHQVSGEICQEAFLAAADPKVFPEMGLPPWAPLKVYARVPFSRVTPEGMFDYATGKTIPTRFHNYVTNQDSTKEPAATVQIHEGEKSTTLGMDGDSYVQFARKGLALQKTQIGSGVRLAPAGAFDSGYTLIASRVGCPKSENSSQAEPFGTPLQTIGLSRSVADNNNDSDNNKSDKSEDIHGIVNNDNNEPLGTPRLQPWVSQPPTKEGAPAPGVCPLPSSEQSLFEGIDVSLPSLATLTSSPAPTLRPTLEAVDKHLAEAQSVFDPAHLNLTAPPLREALRSLDTLLKQTPDTPANFNLLHELRIKRVQLNSALILAHGLTMTATLTDPPSPQPLLTTQTHIAISTKITNAGTEPLAFSAIGLPSILDAKSLYRWPHNKANIPILPASTRTDKLGSDITYALLPATRPYFSRPDLAQPFYDVANPALRNAPATPAPLTASAFLEDQGVELKLAATVTEPASPIQPIAVVPPVTVNLTRTFGVPPFQTQADLTENRKAQTASSNGTVPLGTSTFQLGALLGVEATEDTILGPARIGPDKIPVKLLAPSTWQVSTATYDNHLEPVLEHFTLTPTPLAANHTYPITAEAVFAGHTYKESFRPVGYPGLTLTNYYTPATYRATAIDVHVAPNLRIAYLPGTGDTVSDFLPDLGITPPSSRSPTSPQKP